MTKNLLTNSLTLTALCSTLTFAAPTLANEEQPSWEASAGLGFSLTSGNTDTTSVTTNIHVIQYLETWEMDYKFDGIKQENEGKSTADNKNYAVKGQYKLEDETAFLFVEGKRKEDEFGPFAEQNTIALGYGQQLFESEDVLIRANIGPGFTTYKFNKTSEDDQAPEKDSSSIVHVAGNLKWNISESADFTQSLVFDQQLSDDKNLMVVSQSTLGAKINGSLKMTLDVKITNNSDVQQDKKKTDTITSVNLVYSF